jgi:hypothetical protein
VVAAGRRSFKTETTKRILLIGDKHHEGAFARDGKRFFYALPTRDQAKRNVWSDLKNLTRARWTRQPSESELIIWVRTDDGGEAEIHLVGMDKPARIEGSMWHGGVMDEYADMKPGVWAEHVQPVTADTGAWIVFIGVPDFRAAGGKDFKDLFDSAQRGDSPEWAAFSWKSADVLELEIIAEAKRTMSGPIYLQEYEASFETAPGRAYGSFSVTTHVKPVAYRADLPTLVSLDFNSGHHNWGLYQFDAGANTYRSFDQIYLQSATVEAMAKALR